MTLTVFDVILEKGLRAELRNGETVAGLKKAAHDLYLLEQAAHPRCDGLTQARYYRLLGTIDIAAAE